MTAGSFCVCDRQLFRIVLEGRGKRTTRHIAGLLTVIVLTGLTACSRPAAPVTSPTPPATAPHGPVAAQVVGELSAAVNLLEHRVEGVTAFAFADATHGWFADSSRIFATSDGGLNWSLQFDAGKPVLHLALSRPVRDGLRPAKGSCRPPTAALPGPASRVSGWASSS